MIHLARLYYNGNRLVEARINHLPFEGELFRVYGDIYVATKIISVYDERDKTIWIEEVYLELA